MSVSIFSNVTEKAINIDLIKFLGHSNIINYKQYGSRSKRPINDLPSDISNIWYNTIEKYEKFQTIVIEISKDFHQVWHEDLLK